MRNMISMKIISAIFLRTVASIIIIVVFLVEAKADDNSCCNADKLNEPGSIKIPVAQGTVEPIAQKIATSANSLKVDGAAVDKAIQAWFEDKKAKDPKFYELHEKEWNVAIDESKRKASETWKKIEKEWNSKVDGLSDGLSTQYKIFVDAGPKGRVSGHYHYCDREEESWRSRMEIEGQSRFYSN